MKKLSLALLAALLVLGGAVIVRTAGFTSRQLAVAPARPIAVDGNAMARRLSTAIQFKTISFEEPTELTAAEFRRFHDFLAQSFPRVRQQLTRETVNGQSLLYTWRGADAGLKPILLMGHLDVVPVDPLTERDWTHPPFAGRRAQGFIWGRGAMDNKAGVMAILEAVEHLLAQGFEPRRTIYLAFGHDEEIGGASGAAKIAALLSERGARLEFVLDEGNSIVDGIIPGISAPVALIGIAEKGYLSLELSVETAGGHASTPPRHTAVGLLSRAIYQLERSPWPSRLGAPMRDMLEYLGPEMKWPERAMMANLWLFDPLIRNEFAKSPLTDTTIRTTQAATIFHAGVQDNVLPARARAVVNFRILPGDSAAAVTERARQIIDDGQIKITPLPGSTEPSSVSDINSASFALINRTIREVAPEVLVAPSLLIAITDSRHYAKLAENVYRFFPLKLRADDVPRYHGIDERISMSDYERCVRFYAQLIRNGDVSK